VISNLTVCKTCAYFQFAEFHDHELKENVQNNNQRVTVIEQTLRNLTESVSSLRLEVKSLANLVKPPTRQAVGPYSVSVLTRKTKCLSLICKQNHFYMYYC